MKSNSILRIVGLTGVLAAAAACVRYIPKPISAPGSLDSFESRRLDTPELREFLLASGEVKDWPPAAWDLKALTLAAFYFHPDMDVARAQWGVARAGRITAGERPNPSLNPSLGYNSTSPISEVTPWIPEIALEIPLEVAGKRGFRVAVARQASEAARWNILSSAWEVRSRLRGALLELYAAERAATLQSERLKLQTEIVRILEVQKSAGEVSTYDVTQARIALGSIRLETLETARAAEEARAKIAAALGLPRNALEGAPFSFDAFRSLSPDFPEGEVRRQALLNRSDLLAALSEYDAGQSVLRLEIAKQYPDLRIGPGYQLDQTANKWTIGLAFDLPILSRNKGPIAEAEARRTELAARFLALQAKALGELDAAVADCRAALLKARVADELSAALIRQEASAVRRREAGEISTLELTGVRLELNAGALAGLEMLVKAQEAIGRLETAIQCPLDGKDWIFTKTPARSGTGQEKKND